MKYVKLYVSLLHGPELSGEYSLVLYPTTLGNTDRIAGQNLPNINGQDYNRLPQLFDLNFALYCVQILPTLR